jgi:uncharacterized protein
MILQKKLRKLQRILKRMSSVLVAFSGGVDSTFLVKVAKDVFGDRVVAVTEVSSFLPRSEKIQAQRLAKLLKVKHIFLDAVPPEAAIKNPPQRCYFCKKSLFVQLKKMAGALGLAYVVDASNADDAKDFRPGSKACRELGIRSPLQEAGITKSEIRQLSKGFGLPTWNKPAAACLASRFPYGQRITADALSKVEAAEDLLKRYTDRAIRVRVHGNLARIETDSKVFPVLLKNRESIVRSFKNFGFTFITLDLEGYRQGAMNEELGWKRKK